MGRPLSRIRGFEKVSKYKDVDIAAPCRKTGGAAGYDMAAAHDVLLQPLGSMLNELMGKIYEDKISDADLKTAQDLSMTDRRLANTFLQDKLTLDLDEVKSFMKKNGIKPTLVSTGYKAYMGTSERLDLLIRSSTPLNSFIILANSVGLIDEDYYDNTDNEGEIFFQLLNLSPVPVMIKKGDILGQGVFGVYLKTDDDHLQRKATREGGHGSTNKAK